MIKRQIVALGDNGFRKQPGKPHFFPYLISLTGKAEPKICFIPTASGDKSDYIADFYKSVGPFTRHISVLSLFFGDREDIENLLLEQDIIYVGGGNTRNMLLLWKDWGIDQILRKAYEKGIVLAGGSAGSICWFEEACTDSIPGRLSGMKCLGWLKGSTCPHYDEELNRRPEYHSLFKKGEIKLAGIANQYGVGLHYVNESLHKVVSTRSDGFAFNVALEGSNVKETAIPAEKI